MYILAGLGNPGDEYEGTRHNSGRTIVHAFAKSKGVEDFKADNKSKALVASFEEKSDKAKLLLPDTFMNKSGSAVSYFVKTQSAAKKLIVVHDDLDLPLGSIRIVFNRGSGGHKGVESVKRGIKTNEFIRLRVGISKEFRGRAKKPKGEKDILKFVLGKFDKKESEIFKTVIKKSIAALNSIISEGHDHAMGEFN